MKSALFQAFSSSKPAFYMERAARNGYLFYQVKAVKLTIAFVLPPLRGFSKIPRDLSFVIWIPLETDCDIYKSAHEEMYQISAPCACRCLTKVSAVTPI